MEQKSNVQYRAGKEYKNSREKFFLLLREIISNSIHAVLIRQSKEKGDYIPTLNLTIGIEDSQFRIELTDNGEGFTEENRRCFEELDRRNGEKERHCFHPLGQGRLAIIYFADSAEYETVYKDDNGNFHGRTIPYPHQSEGIFNFNAFVESDSNNSDTYTKLTILINKPNTFGRARTFFKNIQIWNHSNNGL